MGQSPSADLYWGFDLADMAGHEKTWDTLKPSWMRNDDGETDRDWEEELAARLGWQEIPFPEGGPEHPPYENQRQYERAMSEYQRASEAFWVTDEYVAWSANRTAMNQLVRGCPVELRTYGYCDEPQYCVRIKTSVQRAYDWGSTELIPLEIHPDWFSQIMEFMKLMELPIPEGKEPNWHLNCSYG